MALALDLSTLSAPLMVYICRNLKIIDVLGKQFPPKPARPLADVMN